MVARNFQADYQRPVGNGPPRIVALLEYRFLELIGPLAYPPSVVARHFFFTFFLLSLPLFLPLLRRFLPSTMLPWGFRRPSPGRGKITRVRQGRIPRFRLGSVIYSELQRDLSCSLRFLPLSFSLSVVFLLIPPPSSFQFLPTPFSNFFSFSLFLLSSPLGFPSLSRLSFRLSLSLLVPLLAPTFLPRYVSPLRPLLLPSILCLILGFLLLPPLPPNFSSSLHEEGDSSEGGLDIYTGAKREAWPRKNRRPRGEIRDDDAPGRDPATFEMPPSRVA